MELQPSYDVIIVGASFAGLTLAHHLPRNLRVLVIDVKPAAGATVESTGLITSRTRQEFSTFFPIDRFITNPIRSICVIAPGFEESFVSSTDDPWIYQTDTKGLVRHLAETLPANVTCAMTTAFVAPVVDHGKVVAVKLLSYGVEVTVAVRCLVGADGSRSKVASSIEFLDQNKAFLYGYEQVRAGRVHLGERPEETIYHFWFGEFSLGYGGWLSPTMIGGRSAFRIGLAKLLKDRADAKGLMEKFVDELATRGIISFDGVGAGPDYVFGSAIPIGGIRHRTSWSNVLLLGDAAGYCGAFAADGIKGAVVSGKVAAMRIPELLNGDYSALGKIPHDMDAHDGLIGYYKRQLRYRLIWDLMKRDRTFRAMYDVIEAEKESFLEQFCDSKDRRKSLIRIVLKPRHVWRLAKYAGYMLMDLIRGRT